MERSQYFLLDDLPETNLEYLWHGAKNLAKELADKISNIPVTSPVLISGDWGSGKTSLILAIQELIQKERAAEIEAEQESRSRKRSRKQASATTVQVPQTLFFEAWRYESAAPLMPALVRAIWELVPESLRAEDEEVGLNLWQAAMAAATAVGPGLAALAGPGASLLMSGLLALRNHGIEVEEDEKLTQPPIDATRKLAEQFQELLKAYWKVDKPLIILIDDLDRCSATSAVALLDGIRMILNVANGLPDSGGDFRCRFVVALDRTILSDSVSRKFSDVSRYEGNRYLEKVFPITFDLPRPEGPDVHRIVTRLVEKAKERAMGSGFESTTVSLAPEERYLRSQLDALSVALSEPSFINPRLIKRCINRFRLVLSIEKSVDSRRDQRFPATQLGHRGTELKSGEEREAESHDLVALARWIAACERWPGLRRLLQQKSDEYWRRFRAQLADDNLSSLDREAKRLLEEEGVEGWIRREILASQGTNLGEYRQADQRLRACGL